MIFCDVGVSNYFGSYLINYYDMLPAFVKYFSFKFCTLANWIKPTSGIS